MSVGGGVTLHGTAWSSASPPVATVFYVHGIQSHAGWCHRLGSALNAQSIDLVVFDRRGSGMSGGIRGHADGAEAIIDDYRLALEHVRQTSRTSTVTVVGQSFGGSIVAALAAGGSIPTEQIVFCAPALGQQLRRWGVEEMARIGANRGLRMSPVGLSNSDYTRDERYLRFMHDDVLMVHEITTGMRASMVQLEQRYSTVTGWPVHGPIHLAIPEFDKIIDLATAEAILRRSVPMIDKATFPTDEHYLEWSAEHEAYFRWLGAIVTSNAS